MKSHLYLLILLLTFALSACSRTPTSLPTPDISHTSLPRSMKGYELYSWRANNQWYFTLTTGTNRLKRHEEITTGENVITEDGWVKITAVGTDGIKAVFDRLPPEESISWISPSQLKQVEGTGGNLRLPPQSMREELESHCQKLGIQLHVAE